MIFQIKGFKKFQHFKDRKPPWIKLYRELLDDLEWHELDAKAAKVLVMLWLIASESDGVLPDTKKLSFRLRISEKEVISSCNNLSHWLEQVDITAISPRYQETRVETETETETETDIVGDEHRDIENPQSAKPDNPDFMQAWEAYPQRPGASKAAALRAWSARIKDGTSAGEMIAGTKRYAAYCKSQKTEPQFVKQPSTFFGPDKHFLNDYGIKSLKLSDWWTVGGFACEAEARNVCGPSTVHQFRDGQRIEVAA